MSLEAWGDEGFDIPDGYMTVERCQEINAELQAEHNDVADLSRTISTDNDGAWWGDSPDDNLGNIAGYIGRIEALHDNLHDVLLDALTKSVEVIRQWHNMGGAEDVWQIYYDNAPEMQPIRSALSKHSATRRGFRT